jgi:transposase-like protein
VNIEIRRRTDLVSVVPNPEALLLLGGAVLVEQHDEWAAADRRYFSERSMTQVTTPTTMAEGHVTTAEPISA